MENLSAYEYGKLAFDKGITVPALDKDFLENHMVGLNVGEGIKPMKEWLSGWKIAKLENSKCESCGIKTIFLFNLQGLDVCESCYDKEVE